jgi:hypothetical protein
VRTPRKNRGVQRRRPGSFPRGCSAIGLPAAAKRVWGTIAELAGRLPRQKNVQQRALDLRPREGRGTCGGTCGGTAAGSARARGR